ncbi:LamG-like jellyroll fold domain-containing protein [Nocardioides sp. PD653]|uniref:LamG-like jellyroll fold domain-containing protein n=1 Tax=Nocardioides sp. PD653 TaxID=393303 RepID=UPI0009F063AB|nr:LamG-like jellyroll fold domain-containing protein [Nocardioides sp. PD653]GAW52741.1 hypothetical protein PD653_0134 [Nocardioides sp. PD653]
MSSRPARRRALTSALATALALTATLAWVPPSGAAVTTYAGEVLASAPVAYYRLGEPSGPTMVDSSGHGHHGTYGGLVAFGGPPAITNTTDTSAAFTTGSSATGIPAPQTAYTLEAWVRPDDGAPATLVGQAGAGELYISGGFLGLDQSGDDVLSSGPDLTAGTWWHVAATWDGTTTRLYVDGTEGATSVTATTAPSGSNPVILGDGPHGGFIGGLDEVAYYPTALSGAVLAAHVAIGRDSTPPHVTITTPADSGQYVLHAVPAPGYSCTDPLAGSPPSASGIMTCVPGPLAGGLGPHFFTVTGTDRAGNAAARTVAYTVVPNRYADEVLLSSPIAFYRLNDPVGAVTMTDDSGHGRDGLYRNAVAPGGHRPAAISCERRPRPPQVCELAADPQDFSTHFGGNGYGYVSDLPAPKTAYTLEAWIRPDNGDGSIVGQGGAGQLFLRDGHLGLRQTQDDVLSSSPTLTPGVWWHVAAVWNGTSTALFVNGAVVATSSSARKAPSGSATMYVGLGEQAPPFHGDLDEVAYYSTALSGGVLAEHYAVGTAVDWPSISPVPPGTTGVPSAVITTPADDGLYAPAKTPVSDFGCTDPDGSGDVSSCTAAVDGNPLANGDPLPDSLGSHTVTVTAVDQAGNVDTHSVTYTVMPFPDIFRADSPLAYYRLGDTGSVMVDASGNGRDGEYKNDQQSGPVGISGDGDHARRFLGANGYGYANGVAAGPHQSTIEAWANPDDGRDQSIAGLAGTDELFVTGGSFAFRHLDRTVVADVGPTPGAFRQVVGVWDGTNAQIYVDGVLHGTVEAATGSSSAGGGTFYVGYGIRAPWFKGSIDEVAYYRVALTPARVLEHFLADPPPATDCLVPRLRGRRVAVARDALAWAGCTLGTVSHRAAAPRDRGRVLAQSVPPGSALPGGRSIDVTVGR